MAPNNQGNPGWVITTSDRNALNRLGIFFVLLFALFVPLEASASPDNPIFQEGLELLKERSFDSKAEGIKKLAESGQDEARGVLTVMQSGDLYLDKESESLVIAKRTDDGYQIFDLYSQEPLGEVGRRAVKKVSINNQLRNDISAAIARMDLNHLDPDLRRSAAQAMLSELTTETLPLFEERLAVETDEDIQQLLQTALAISNLDSTEVGIQIKALRFLEQNLESEVRNRVTRLISETEHPRVKAAAEKTLRTIQDRIEFYGHLETLYFGLSLGSVLVLAAIGLAITFGVMGVINMAHGELIMIGAYTTYVIQQLMPDAIEYSIIVAIPAAFVVSGLVGILIERTVIRFLYGRALETLLATFGLSLILQQLLRSVFSPLNRSVETPEWMSGVWEWNAIFSLTLNRLYIIALCLIVFAALFMVLKRTRLGLEVRAVSQNRDMARAMGIRTQRVDMMTFGLGSGIAGVAGVALSQLTNVGPNLGQAYIIDSFMVVVFGGVGNLWGTLLAGLSLGIANKAIEPFAGAVLAKILILIFIILFIQKRPQGLFPQKGRAAEG